MRTGRVPLAALLLVLAFSVLQISCTNDLYWEGEEYGSNEFLEVKPEDSTALDSHKRLKRAWNFWFPPEAETVTTPVSDDTGSYDKDDADLDVGSGVPDKTASEPKEKTLRVSFTVMEPYRAAYSNRDSSEFLNISHSLANAVDMLFENLPGTQRSSLVRIQSLVSDDFLCKVTLDIVTTRYEDTDTIKEILRNHIKNNGRLGQTPVRDGDFSAQLIDPGTTFECDITEFPCEDSCLPLSMKCNGREDCRDGTDEIDCPVPDTSNEPRTTDTTTAKYNNNIDENISSTPDYGNFDQAPDNSNYNQSLENPYEPNPDSQNPYEQTTGSSYDPYGENTRPDNRDPYGENTRPDNRDPYGENIRPDNRDPSGENTRPDNRDPYGENTRPDNRDPYGENTRPDNRDPYGENTRPDNRDPSGENTRPDNRDPYGENTRSDNRDPYGENTRPDNRDPYGENTRPDNRNPYGENTRPDNRDPYGENTRPDNRDPYGENTRPDNRDPSGENTRPDNRDPYGENTRPNNRDPYGENTRPDNRNPYGENTRPDNRDPYGENTRPDNRDPYGENTRPDNRDPSGENTRPDNRDPYGENTRPDNRDPSGENTRPDNRDPYGENTRPNNRDPYGENTRADNSDPYGQSTRPDNRDPYDQSTSPNIWDSNFSQNTRPDNRDPSQSENTEAQENSDDRSPDAGTSNDQISGSYPRGDLGGVNDYSTDTPDEPYTVTETIDAVNTSTTRKYNECPPTYIRCDETRCVEQTRRCDGRNDCYDRTDEDNCPSPGNSLKMWQLPFSLRINFINRCHKEF